MSQLRTLYLAFAFLSLAHLVRAEETPRVSLPIQHEHAGSADLPVPRSVRQITVEAIQVTLLRFGSHS